MKLNEVELNGFSCKLIVISNIDRTIILSSDGLKKILRLSEISIISLFSFGLPQFAA